MSQQISFLVDMEAIDDIIATGFAIDSIGRQSRYMQDLIGAAYADANADFNREVIAYATASGHMGHMFEWGTTGINTSKSNMRLSPTDPNARLWKNEFSAGRKWSNLSFSFKPSVATVPKPPAEKTGIDQNTINRLNTHIFWNKAFVMETGVRVTIKPKGDNLLFVPNIWYGEEGYTMYARPTHPDISKGTAGTFTAMWLDFWNNRGADSMTSQVANNFRIDVEIAYKNIKSGQKLRRPDEYRESVIAYKVKTIRKYFERAAQERLSRKKVSEYAD